MNSYSYQGGHHLIQDIYVGRTPRNYLNKARRPASIGELDDTWRQQARRAAHGLGILPHAISTAQYKPLRYDPQRLVA